MALRQDVLIEALDWYYSCGGKLRPAARESGIPRNTLRHRLKLAKSAGLEPSGHDPRHDYMSPDEVSTAQSIGVVSKHLDGGWKFEYDADGNKLGSHRYSIDKPQGDTQAFSAALADGLSNIPPSAPSAAPEHCDSDLLAVIPIFDAHIGMLARDDSSEVEWDRKAALQRVSDAVGSMVNASPGCKSALVIFGGDTSHTDNKEAVTPRGRNPLDADGSYFEIIASTIAAIKISVDLALGKYATVTVRIMRGNHDEHAYVALTMAIAEHYSNDPRAHVETTENDYLIQEFGTNMIVAHHGDKAKPEQLVMFAADQFSKVWGRTKHRLILTGHIHHETRRDVGGATVESMRSMAPRDDYAYSRGYTGRSTTYLIILHRTGGETLRIKKNF